MSLKRKKRFFIAGYESKLNAPCFFKNRIVLYGIFVETRLRE
jgi:hypothetical protein